MRLRNKVFHGISFIFTDTFSGIATIFIGYPNSHQINLYNTFGQKCFFGAEIFNVKNLCYKTQQATDLASGHFFGLAHQVAHNTLGFVYIIFRHLFRRDLRRQLILLSIAATAVIAAGTAAVSVVAVVISAPVVVIATAAIAAAIIIPSCHLCRHPFCSDRHKYKLR